MSDALRGVPPSVNSWSAEYLDAEYARFKADPASVPADLRSFFQGFDLAAARTGAGRAAGGAPTDSVTAEALRFQSAVADLIEAYRSMGHLAAKLDPFGRAPQQPRVLSLEYHGLSERDLDRPVNHGTLPLPAEATLRDIVAFLERTYCASIGVQWGHIVDAEERTWLQQRFEQHGGRIPLDRGDKAHILERIVRAEQFEKFLQKRYPGDKRFSLEGGEALIPLMDRVIDAASELGVEEMVLGMPHRGRLNVLNNILGKSYEQIFTEFEDTWADEGGGGGGDVKYHRGYSGERTLRNGRSIHLAMASNPSHLESVNGVVMGRCRGKQRTRGDEARTRVIPMLLHGDAAFIGQGTVAEALNLSRLEGYTVGGTVHVVVNNLIGFTTGPEDARSTRYCTDIALMLESPVFHVNGEDPEACIACAQIAVEYRQKFRKDVFIDMYCFRRYGHNEQDEASFTQPILTSLVKAQPGVLHTYSRKLLAEGVINEADMEAIRRRLDEALEQAQQAAKKKPYDPTIDPGSKRWSGFGGAYSFEPVPTGATMAEIEQVCAALGRVPEGFHVNPKLKQLLADRAALPRTGEVSYADAESLAFGTLLMQGHDVRLSGQDCRRGTFSHRHAVLRDMVTEAAYVPLNNILPQADGLDGQPPRADGRTQSRLHVYDSPLSEAAVMAYDYGYSLTDPNILVMWEAQFGDFANGAQVIIDQYLASGEMKWERWSGLTLLLPHGYEGAGPEHSSCRIERFLQLCANDNMQVCYPSTAAQAFHMLRRQVKARFRKPLIVATPKSLLRVPTSRIEELTSGHFQHLLDDPAATAGKVDRARVKKVYVCAGKFYHELAARREANGRFDTALVRVEQFYPFDAALAKRILAQYPGAQSVTWVQEEPRNAGAYLFMADLFRTHLGIDLHYIGRAASATPATGSKHAHKDQQEAVLTEAFGPAGAKAAPHATHAGNGAASPPAASKPAAKPAKAKA
jgi:2-oxoglutarate dehydrogenase E1 component